MPGEPNASPFPYHPDYASLMGAGSSTPPPALDVLVSGLVVGAGTKPLHDLIANIQASKDAKQAQVPTAPPG